MLPVICKKRVDTGGISIADAFLFSYRRWNRYLKECEALEIESNGGEAMETASNPGTEIVGNGSFDLDSSNTRDEATSFRDLTKHLKIIHFNGFAA